MTTVDSESRRDRLSELETDENLDLEKWLFRQTFAVRNFVGARFVARRKTVARVLGRLDRLNRRERRRRAAEKRRFAGDRRVAAPNGNGLRVERRGRSRVRVRRAVAFCVRGADFPATRWPPRASRRWRRIIERATPTPRRVERTSRRKFIAAKKAAGECSTDCAKTPFGRAATVFARRRPSAAIRNRKSGSKSSRPFGDRNTRSRLRRRTRNAWRRARTARDRSLETSSPPSREGAFRPRRFEGAPRTES